MFDQHILGNQCPVSRCMFKAKKGRFFGGTWMSPKSNVLIFHFKTYNELNSLGEI